ncbi:MAG: glycosyltransferase family 2 protein, partial [Candidatus Hydrothermarchaeaceae archaeon]
MSEDGRIKELEDAIQETLREIEALNNAVQSRDEQMGNLKSELEQMRRSATWRALMGFHELLEDLLPLGTGRRMYYEELIGRIAAARKDGGSEKTEEKPKEVRLEDWDGERITFPEPPESPDVSIVIPVYNHCGYTYNCLKSVLKNTRGPYEVVVVDDASKDRTPELLKSAENVRVVVNEENLGFVESCNAGVKAANGRYVFFLNNDAFVTENWLEPLMEAMERDKVGAVGSKLVYPDGKMQEAGSIIWKDASSQNYGRGDDPEKPEYNFVREVDYCSGAALLVRRDLFEKIGGFDARFSPGYYEETDLCFSLRKMGYRVLYQPRSVVIHFEAVTSGTDITSGVRKYLVLNREKFLEKWSDVLEGRYDPDPSNQFSARHARKGKNILIIDHRIPIIDKDSGSCRMHNMLKILIELGYRVTFIGNNSGRFEPHTSIIQQIGVEVVYDPHISSMWEYLGKNGKFFDIVILGRAQIAAKHISSVKRYCGKAKLIFDTVDLQFLREQRRA